jgi:hypothetical protein
MGIVEPAGLWSRVGQRCQQPGVSSVLVSISVLGGLAVTLATEIGLRVFNTEWSPVFGYSARPESEGAHFALLWFALALAPWAQAAVGALLLPFYRRPRQWLAAFAVFVIGTVPLYVAGLSLLLLPGILLVSVAFFISFVWWTTGARELLGVPHGEAIEFVTMTVLGTSSALFVCSTAFPF